MKIILKCLLGFMILLIPVSVFASYFWSSGWTEYICKWEECSIEAWITSTYETLKNVEQERPLSQYVIDVVKYILTFVALVWVIIILYAWFNILISAWDEEKVKTSRKIIIYVLIGILVIFLAFPIILWFEGVLNAPPVG
jgi:small-conductance mechanosensitive channel